MNEMSFSNRYEFREWLEDNALSDDGVWLVFRKQGKPTSLKASEALEEALCFGWIDGQVQRIDEASYRKYFKQRGRTSKWSERNMKIVEELELKELMTDFGRAKIELAKQNGYWDPPKSESLTEDQLQQFEHMLKPYETALASFLSMSPSARKAYAASYFLGAKTEDGKQRRFETIIERLNLNLNPVESMKKKKGNS